MLIRMGFQRIYQISLLYVNHGLGQKVNRGMMMDVVEWPWIDRYPQGFGLSPSGQLEQVCVGIAGTTNRNIGRSFDSPTQQEPDIKHPELGIYFSQQWEHALQVNPPFVFVTGWNE